MSRSGQQQPALHLPRELAARVLYLLQPQNEIAIDLDATDPLGQAEINDLLVRVQRRHQAASIFTRLPFGNQGEQPMLGPGTGIVSTGAVLLAFHAGGGVAVEALSGSLGLPSDEAGDALYRARMAIIEIDSPGCERVRSLLGRYTDTSVDRDEMTGLINHSRACPQCSAVLEQFRSLDERIREAVEQAPVTPPATADHIAGLRRNPLLLWAPILLVIAFAIAALAAIGFGATSQTSVSPLFAAKEVGEHRGWLILSSEQEVMAFDLESGERRRILEHPAHDWWNPWIISPDAELAIRWEEYSRNEQRVGALRAYDMHGERQHLHRWFSARARTFNGWLDNQTVLFVARGPIQRVGVESEIPDEAAPSIIAADLVTGDERVIYQGQLDKAVPSPDGQHLAIVRPAPAPWPGKTVEILSIEDGAVQESVATLEYRHLSWPGRMIWSDDSAAVYFPAIHRDDLPNPLPAEGESAPGTFDFDRLHLVGLGTDGTIAEYDSLAGEQGWIVPQAVNPEADLIAVVVNESLDRDEEWQHGLLDLRSGEFTLSKQSVAGSRWWNTEALWTPHEDGFLTQHVRTDRFPTSDIEGMPDSLVIEPSELENGANPTMVFQDTTSLSLRSGTGLGLLRWVPDEVMRTSESEPAGRPRASIPRGLSQATSDQRLITESSVASTGRYVLLSQQDPEAGSRERLIHLQAWAGTESDLNGTQDFSWIPREPAVIGVVNPDEENDQASRLTFVGTDRISPLHGLQIDPAGIGNRTDLAYRLPLISPNGANLAFLVQNLTSGESTLWLEAWGEDPVPVESWDIPDDARIEPSLALRWISDDELVFANVTEWDDGYPRNISLRRIDIRSNEFELTTVHSLRARGRDHGIDLVEFELSPDDERIALRLRHFTGSNPDEDASDAIHVSTTSDLSQGLEIKRSSTGEGLAWLDGSDWLVAGISDRIALLEGTGRDSEYISEAPSALPVLIGPGEIWYQDLSEDGRIMRVSFE